MIGCPKAKHASVHDNSLRRQSLLDDSTKPCCTCPKVQSRHVKMWCGDQHCDADVLSRWSATRHQPRPWLRKHHDGGLAHLVQNSVC